MVKKEDCSCEDDCSCGDEDFCEDENCSCESPSHEAMQNPFANLDQDTQIKIQEMQYIEQNLQQILMQKQAFNLEQNETTHALEELKNADNEVFKIVGNQIIVKSTKENLTKDLTQKKELIELRLKNLDKQEKDFSDKINSLRDEVLKAISSKKV
jgi:prefoldin beta subunit